ncbi:MAG: hypothetical protein ACJAT1_000047 [Marivirga sp.]|jgi:hypothetical protein
MRYFLAISVFILLSQNSVKCQHIVAGFVLTEQDSSGIEGTHIINISNKEYAISAKNGGFTIKVAKYDTLLFSNINFERRKFIILKFAPIAILLRPINIHLDEVIVSNIPKSAAEFRKIVINMENQEADNFEIEGLQPIKRKAPIPPLFQEEKLLNFGRSNNSFSNLISLFTIPIYYFPKKFNKKYKSEMRYHKLQSETTDKITIEKKFNREIVQQFTKFKEEKLNQFIAYLNIDDSFLLDATEYEIAAYIQHKQSEFNTPQKQDSSNLSIKTPG